MSAVTSQDYKSELQAGTIGQGFAKHFNQQVKIATEYNGSSEDLPVQGILWKLAKFVEK